MKARINKVIVATVIVAECVFVGCSSVSGTENGPSSTGAFAYVEAAWMAQMRQETEEKTVQMVACMAEKGWTISTHPDGIIEMPDTTTEAQRDLAFHALDTCETLIYGDTSPTDVQTWRVYYAHALDTKRCLEAQGYRVSDPPSEDVYVEAGVSNQTVWNPFESAVGGVKLDAATYYALFAECPQDGQKFAMYDERWG